MSDDRGPVLVVAACIGRADAREVILARRNQPSVPGAHLRWELPGGKVKLGETPQDAVRRELHEELGTEIRIVRLLPHLQTNIYHRTDGTIGHFHVIAFESVLVAGGPAPETKDPGVLGFKWVRVDQLPGPLLPGTLQFIECLNRLDRATYDEAHMFVRLEKRVSGNATDYWDFQCVYDLWGDFNLLERHMNLKTRSTHSHVFHTESSSALVERLKQRVRSLARHGYEVACSNTSILRAGT